MSSEAPISVNTRVKSPNGFEWQITLRDGATEESFQALMTLIANKELRLLEKKWVPVEPKSFSKFPPKQVEYAEGQCPKCQSRLVNGTTTAGKKFVKCETNKWNRSLNKAEGCEWIRWAEMQQSDL